METFHVQGMVNSTLVKLIKDFNITMEDVTAVIDNIEENKLDRIHAVAQILQGVENDREFRNMFRLEGNTYIGGMKPYSYDLNFEIRDMLKYGRDIEGTIQSRREDLINELKALDTNTLQIISTAYFLKDHHDSDTLKNVVEMVTGKVSYEINGAFKKFEEIEKKWGSSTIYGYQID